MHEALIGAKDIALEPYAEILPSPISYSINRGGRYGEMPYDALAEKFEETDIGDEEERYETFARQTLTNWTSDAPSMEHEAPRGAVDRRKGFLNLRYGGHRGETDDPAHPELMLGFHGPEDKDPRQASLDPDFKKAKGQWDARMRFHRFSDAEPMNTTGGTISEERVIKNRVKLFKQVKDRLQVFSSQKDGRRNPLRRAFQKKHVGNSTDIAIQSYGDLITDQSLNPQRRATILSNQIIRNTAWYHQNTTDHEFNVAQYGNVGRKSMSRTGKVAVGAMVDGSETAAQMKSHPTEDLTKCYKALAILMTNVIAARQNLQGAAVGDTTYTDEYGNQFRSQAKLTRDLIKVMRQITGDGSYAESDLSMGYSQMTPKQRKHLLRLVSFNHAVSEHELLTAFKMYRSVTPAKDVEGIRHAAEEDAHGPEMGATETLKYKSANESIKAGIARHGGLVATDVHVGGKMLQTFNYRAGERFASSQRVRNTSKEQFGAESDKSRVYGAGPGNYRITGQDDIQVEKQQFHENYMQDRHAAPIGKKYMRGFIDNDSRSNEIAAKS
jgi:hypothetical protein